MAKRRVKKQKRKQPAKVRKVEAKRARGLGDKLDFSSWDLKTADTFHNQLRVHFDKFTSALDKLDWGNMVEKAISEACNIAIKERCLVQFHFLYNVKASPGTIEVEVPLGYYSDNNPVWTFDLHEVVTNLFDEMINLIEGRECTFEEVLDIGKRIAGELREQATRIEERSKKFRPAKPRPGEIEVEVPVAEAE